MKTQLALATLVGGALFCTGCFTMATASSESFSKARRQGVNGAPREHVVVSNYGWFLFNTIPLVCGNAREGARIPFVFFRNDVTSDIVHDKLTSYAAAKGADLSDINLFFSENVLFEIPGTSIPIPMPYVLCYREHLISGLLVDRPKAKPAPKTETQARRKVDPSVKRRRDLQKLLEDIPDGGVK